MKFIALFRKKGPDVEGWWLRVEKGHSPRTFYLTQEAIETSKKFEDSYMKPVKNVVWAKIPADKPFRKGG